LPVSRGAIAVVALPTGSIGQAFAADEASADLTIAYDDGAGTQSSWHLTCAPAGGDLPDPATACTVLAEHAQTALLTPTSAFCAQPAPNTLNYGGPQTAHVTGTWQGQPVDTELSRSDSCQISRWDALVGLVPAADS
jgi:hypothetical protein